MNPRYIPQHFVEQRELAALQHQMGIFRPPPLLEHKKDLNHVFLPTDSETEIVQPIPFKVEHGENSVAPGSPVPYGHPVKMESEDPSDDIGDPGDDSEEDSLPSSQKSASRQKLS